MENSDTEGDPRNDAEEYVPGTIQTASQRRTRGPQTRRCRKIDWLSLSGGLLPPYLIWTRRRSDDLLISSRKPEGRPARGRRSTKRP